MNHAKTYGAAAAALVLAALMVAAWVQTPAAGDRRPSAAVGANPTAAAVQQQVDQMIEARSKGSDDAPIMIYEMSDFQCPVCLRFFDDYVPTIERDYIETGKVKFTFLNLPLITLHSNAAEAHEYAMCAAAQDRFWDMHDRLFETQEAWSPMGDPTLHFVSLTEQLGLDQTALRQCVESGAVRSLIAEEVRMASQNQLNGTPTFIIEGLALQGLLPGELPAFLGILDSIYAERIAGS